MLPLVVLEMYLELFVSVVHSYIFSLCVSIFVNNIIFYLILFVCYHIPFCTALKQPNCFINSMELIQGSQICKGKLWYEIVSMKNVIQRRTVVSSSNEPILKQIQTFR